jgi:hypothetical protein
MQNTNKAYNLIKKHVLDIIKNNRELLYEISYEDIVSIKNDKDCILEWVLGEYLESYNLIDVVFAEWDENDIRHTIYKIGNKYVEETVKCGFYLKEPHTFQLVKPIKGKIEVIEYLPISENEN